MSRSTACRDSPRQARRRTPKHLVQSPRFRIAVQLPRFLISLGARRLRTCRGFLFESALFCDEVLHAVFLAQLGLFDFSRRVARDLGKDDLARALVAWQRKAELVDLVFGQLCVGLHLDDGSGNLAQALVGEPDDGDVLDGRMRQRKSSTCTG